MTSWLGECVAVGFVMVLGSLASGAGVGGGALYIPLFIILLSPQKLAIPLSKACAFGASVAMYVVNSRRRRPKADGTGHKPLIDYRMAVLLEPFTLLGTMLGVRLNKLLPFPIVATMMAVIMTMISMKTFHRAFALHRQEIAIAKANADEETETTSKCIDVAEEPSDCAEASSGQSGPPPNQDDPQFPKVPLIMMLVYWTLGVAPSILVSGQYGLVRCMSTGYYVIMLGSMMLLLTVAGVNAVLEIRRSARIDQALLAKDADNVHWTFKSVTYFSSVSFGAGVFSALVGVGGSTIKGPFLTHITAPDIASSTAGFMLLSTCSASMFQFMLLDMLDFHSAAAFLVAGFVAAYFGSRVWAYIVKAWDKRSIIVFLLASYVSLATVAMSILSVYEIYYTPSLTDVDSIC